MAVTAYSIKKFGVLSVAKFFAVVGLVWGFLSGLVILLSYIWGYSTNGQTALLQTGLTGLCMMILSGVIGGFIGGVIIAFVYNKVLGKTHGIRMDLDTKA
jgi:hypothetical protein